MRGGWREVGRAHEGDTSVAVGMRARGPQPGGDLLGGAAEIGGDRGRSRLQLGEDLLGGAREDRAHELGEGVGGRGEHVEGHREEDEGREAERDREGEELEHLQHV